MSSVVSICNQAIGRFRGRQIAALTDDTVEANACSTYYESARDLVLADFPWNFATKTAALALKSETPVEWAYCYAYPADCMVIRKLFAEGNLRQYTDPIPHAVELAADDSKAILTNLDVARIQYTVKNENVNQYSAHFRTALSWYLASEIAIPIAGVSKGRVLADRAAQGYVNAINAAMSANANEGDEGPPRDPESIRAHQ
jgi:hypothetical protein